MSNIALALNAIDNWNGDQDRFVLDSVFVDYLQRIPFEGQPESKVIGTEEVLNRLKDGALAFGCPIVCGVQARREVDQRDIPVPDSDDGQWTSAIEQVCDKLLSVTRPAKYRKEGETFGKREPVIVSGHNQMLIALLKQKLGIANRHYWVNFDPRYNLLDELEARYIDLNA